MSEKEISPNVAILRNRIASELGQEALQVVPFVLANVVYGDGSTSPVERWVPSPRGWICLDSERDAIHATSTARLVPVA